MLAGFAGSKTTIAALLQLLMLLPATLAIGSLKDRLEQCRTFCPPKCLPCNLRYVFAQYHLEVDCAFAANSDRDIARLVDCEALSELNVLIVTKVLKAERLLPRLSHLTKLTHLNLSDNRLTRLQPGIFSRFRELKQLVLDDNELVNITPQSLSVPSLQRLSLKNNHIRRVSAEAFSSPANHLNYIDMRGNKLEVVTNWPLRIRRERTQEKLRLLLDQNNIRRFDDTDGSQDQRERKLTRIHWTKELIENTNLIISLAQNNVTHLVDIVRGWNMDDRTISVLGKRRAIVFVSMDGNPLVCDCRDYEMYVSPNNISNLLQDSLVLPYCKAPEDLKYRSMYTLAFSLALPRSYLVCRRPCKNNKCTCTKEPWRRTVSVDCSHLSLGRLPHRRELVRLPHGYSFRFNFSASRLQRKLPGMPSVYREARTLDLSGTGLEELPLKFINKLRRIEVLNLNHNLFTTLDRGIADLPFPHLRQLRLDQNPWACVCNNTWLLRWLRSMRQQLQYAENITCTHPTWLAGKSLLHLSLNDMCGPPKTSNRSYDRIALSSSAISGAVAIATVFVFLVFCTRVSLFTKFGFHPFDRDECVGELKRCDAFVLFHPNDSDWVLSVLVEKLTNRPSPYVLCTHERACVPGLLTYSAVCHAVENSKRVIAVVTESFISDVDVCTDYQLTVTFLNRTQPRQANRLIHILFPNVRHVPQNLVRHTMSAKTVIRYGRKNFWKEVLYRMPLTTVNQLSATKPPSSTARDYSSSFHTLNEDQRNSLLNKPAQDYCISYSNVYESSAERNLVQQPTNSSQSISSLNIYPQQASIFTFPRSSRVSTFRAPEEEQLSVTNFNEATL